MQQGKIIKIEEFPLPKRVEVTPDKDDKRIFVPDWPVKKPTPVPVEPITEPVK